MHGSVPGDKYENPRDQPPIKHKVNSKTFKNYMNAENQKPTCNQQTADITEENN